MGNLAVSGQIVARQTHRLIAGRTRVGAAVALVLHGVSGHAQQSLAVDASSQTPGALQEIIVTATRRQETAEEVPYSLSVISADLLTNTGVTDIASLTSQVPGLSMYDFGGRSAGTATAIIRGINATDGIPNDAFHASEQSPVGVYIGNSPIDGYFQLQDIQRIEVLRGPQGTLYGAGALGGAIRIIPNAPQLGALDGYVEVGSVNIAHSSDFGYTGNAVLNVPLGETVAFRLAGQYEYEPGYIDVYGILKRPGSIISGVPTLADPAQPVSSSGIFSGKKAWNDRKTETARGSLLWKPSETFNAELAFTYSSSNGDGTGGVNGSFGGGSYPIDPRVTFPAGGSYRDFSAVDQPFERTTDLASLDVSYDAGFATVSSTSSYFTTGGYSTTDATYLLDAQPSLVPYYGGSPLNPRFVNPNLFDDSEHTFTQELRVVSNTSKDASIDYVFGLFYERQGRRGEWYDANPGSPEYSVAQGCKAPYFSGSSFPDCLVIGGPGDVHFYQLDNQSFQDKSEFGELTWHFLPHGQLILGGRHFAQTFSDMQIYDLYTFPPILPPVSQDTSLSKNNWKANVSYEYATGHHVYAIWSQGFRRGGSNAVPQTGFYKEGPGLLTYTPDSTDNYEVGVKGHFAETFSYTFDVFDIEWRNPQIGGNTPVGNIAVWNANKARSKGIEFSLEKQLFIPGLRLSLSGAYTDATLAENYSIATNNGTGVITPGAISASAGQQLPGSSKISTAATVAYVLQPLAAWQLTFSMNDTYRGPMVFANFDIHAPPSPGVSGLNLVNLSARLDHENWKAGLLVTNLTDKYTLLSPGIQGGIFGTDYIINRPREIRFTLGYSF